MSKDKRSFLQRLTGSISIVDEDEMYDAPVRGGHEPAPVLEDDPEEGELSVDVYERPGEIIIQAMVAGVRPEDLEINIGREMVTIRGSRETSREVASDNYFHRELYWGAFSRTILLPAEVEAEEAEATEKHGLLTIKIPKIDKGRTAKLKVKSM